MTRRLPLLITAALFLSTPACQCGEPIVQAKAELVAEPASLDFGSTSPGTPVARQVTLTNLGTVTATLTRLALGGQAPDVFSFEAPATTALAAGESVALTVVYSPSRAGAHAARLLVSSDANELPIALVGTAEEAACPGGCATAPGPCRGGPGSCLAGVCVFQPLPDGTACDDGEVCSVGDACFAGECRGATVQCGVAPEPSCVDAQTLRTTTGAGACEADGVCHFAQLDTTCAWGCDTLFQACATAAPDAGMADAGMADAGMADAGMADAGMADAGMTDAGIADAGVPDAGVPDAGAPDAGGADAGADAGFASELIATDGIWPTMAITADRIYVAFVSRAGSTHAVVSVLERSTNTWSQVAFTGTTTRPVVRVDATGKVYFLDSSDTGALIYKESTDHGATWTSISLSSFALTVAQSGDVVASRLTADLVIDAANRPHLLVPRYTPTGSGAAYAIAHLWRNTSWTIDYPTGSLLTAPRGVAQPGGSIDVVYTTEATLGFTYTIRQAHWSNGAWTYASLTTSRAHNTTAHPVTMHPVATAGGTLLTTWLLEESSPTRQTVWTWAGGSMSAAQVRPYQRSDVSLALERDVTQRPLVVYAEESVNSELELLRQAPDAGWTSTTLMRGHHQAIAVEGTTLFIAFVDSVTNQLQLTRVPLQ